MDKTLYVTEPSIPSLQDFLPYLESIWNKRRLTNHGPFHEQLENELCEFLGVKYLSLFCNGTTALNVAIRALDLSGDVITSPFTFPATTHALAWSNCDPVFCDIEPNSFNIDPKKVEAQITSKTSGIVATHVYGFPCQMEALQNICNQYNIKLIYDAAHAFNVKLNNTSILNAGNASILSFHATKVFNTIEGGCIITSDYELKKKFDSLRNFGYENESTIGSIGINGKMNELQAAFGLLSLKNAVDNITKRRRCFNQYSSALKNTMGITVPYPPPNLSHNYSYFPVLICDSFPVTRDDLYKIFRSNNILSRKYFYPLTSELAPYRKLHSSNQGNLSNASKVSSKILCLPIHSELTDSEVARVIAVIKSPLSFN